jgi:CDP-paratose 2-epimerase
MGAIDAVFHEAAQVAVTTSVEEPRRDFEINAVGTLNLLEALRLERQNPAVVVASTNKVYGALESLKVIEKDERYAFRDAPEGVSEDMPLDFYSPYGCSKGAADQYALDYRRIYGFAQ